MLVVTDKVLGIILAVWGEMYLKKDFQHNSLFIVEHLCIKNMDARYNMYRMYTIDTMYTLYYNGGMQRR